ncbi:ABC transporter substrate-binding protein [Paenibacillus kribbensis]|uniref:ABC transporter substrate-binding protein n=1 Tax=Paenibacillus kribbensis TaxID=172713 RepID=A0A222WKK3_9BACL|nr:AraC family transcriptional regulator [Paenibacillus kribbensis]ASR46508.1 ABC transporter substrate-binding protein [Paenibacillus kribbensis]
MKQDRKKQAGSQSGIGKEHEADELNRLLSTWLHSSIRIMDIRHIRLEPEELLQPYRLPAQAFILVLQGSVRLGGEWNDTAHSGYILHGSKGFELKISPSNRGIEYFLVLYKVTSLSGPAVHHLPAIAHGFVPPYPVMLYQKLQLLERTWQDRDALSRVQAQSRFFDFAYEFMRQYQEQQTQIPARDTVTQAIRFMEVHYAESITLERLAGLLECSPRHLTRLFKKQTDCSPITYLIRLRMDKAKELLRKTDATLQDIAVGVGYPDVYFFSRAFKKYIGVSPVHYRDSLHSSAFVRDERLDNPLPMSGCSIDSKSGALHTVIEDNNHYQNYDEGILRMNRNARHSMAFILLLSFTLLLSACSGTSSPAATEGTSQGTNNTVEQASQERVLKDALGHEVKVPAQPQRVIASYLEDHLVALGVKPVAQWSVGKNSVQGYLQKELKDVPTIASDLPFEAVLNFKPDLIIMDSASMVEGDKYNQYSKIAPTYVVGSNMNNDWRQELLTVGEVLNKSSEAKQALSNYDKKGAEAKAKLSQTVGQKTAAALWVTDKNVYVVNQNLSSGDVLYKDLGFKIPQVVQEISKTAKANWSNLSLEKLAELDADYIFIVNSKNVSKEEIIKDPVWAGIPAVKAGHVYDFGKDSSWLYTGTIANGQMIDDVLKNVIQ